MQYKEPSLVVKACHGPRLFPDRYLLPSNDANQSTAVHHEPPFDVFSHRYQHCRDRFDEQHHLKGGRLDECIDAAEGAWLTGAAEVLIPFALSERRRHGITQQELADSMGVDRTTIVHAQNRGGLGIVPFLNLLCDKKLLHNLADQSDRLLDEVGRAGMIAAAHALVALLNLQLSTPLNTATYEALCALIEHAAPVSFQDYPEIRKLYRDWIGPLTYAFAIVEGIGNPDLWWKRYRSNPATRC